MAPEAKSVPDGPDAVLIECSGQVADPRQIVERLFPRVQLATFQVAYGHCQHVPITCDGDIPRNNKGQPKVIIGATGSDTPAFRRMPPVLYIAFCKLPGGMQQDLFAGQVGPGMKNGQHILKLIPETKGPTGLVKSAPAKDPAGQG